MPGGSDSEYAPTSQASPMKEMPAPETPFTVSRGRLRPSSRPAAALVFAAGLAALAGCGGSSSSGGAPGAVAAATVTTHKVEEVDWVDSIEALGTARANESVTLSAKVTEVVRRVRFQDGDHVQPGQVLVELTGEAEVAQLEEARAALNETQQQLDRMEGLVAQGTIPRAQYDTQRAARDTARARVDAIRARLAERVITAPFAGTLGFRQVSDGALVTPGTVITTLDDISIIKLDFAVPESYIAAIAPGQRIQALSGAYRDRQFDGVVASVDSRVDPVTRSVVIRANIDNPDGVLKPGMLLTVRLLTQARQAVVAPELAINQVANRSFVFRLRDAETVEEVDVRIGSRRRGEVEILGGLAPGDEIVVDGIVKLRDGARVAVIGRSGAPTAGISAN